MNINDLYRDYVSSTVEYSQWVAQYNMVHLALFFFSVIVFALFIMLSSRKNKVAIFVGIFTFSLLGASMLGRFEEMFNPTVVDTPAQLSNKMVDEIDRQIKDTYQVDSVSFFYAHEKENINEKMKEHRIKTNKLWGTLSFSDTKRGMDDLNFVNVRVGDNAYKYYIEADESGRAQLIKNSISDAPDPSTLKK